MSFRMALDLGLHLDSHRLVELGYLSEEESNIRAITFWGCFIFDRYLIPEFGKLLTLTADGQLIWVVQRLYHARLSTRNDHRLMLKRRPSRGNRTIIPTI